MRPSPKSGQRTCYIFIPMNAVARITLLLFIYAITWQAVYGQAVFPEPNQDRALALESAESVRTQGVLKTLYQSARAGDSRQVLDTLQAVERNDNWPVAAREYLIWSFAQGLADMESNIIGREVLDYLSAYRPQTLVAHDDRSDRGVPLFNIPVAAAGLRNSWARQQAALDAKILFQYDPAAWINAYLGADPAERRGFIDALDFATDEQLLGLGSSALERLGEQAALTGVAGRSALLLGDLELLQATLSLGSGPDIHRILKAASLNLDAEDNKQLLLHTIHLDLGNKAGLAIAQLAPALLDDPEVRDRMFNMLENRNLGTSAALVLGSSTNPEIRGRLNALANRKDGLASKRASLAIASDLQPREANR